MVFVYILLCVVVNSCFGRTYHSSRHLYDKVLTNYTRHVKPRELSDDVVNVYVDFNINAVVDYDEKSGVFSFLGKFTLTWLDSIIMWNKSEHYNLDSIQVSIHDVWVPHIVVGNSISYNSIYKFDNFFDSNLVYVTYNHNGSARISSFGLWQTSCNSNVKYFPFDQHDCEIQLYSLEPANDIMIKTHQIGACINHTSMHSEFTIQRSSVKSDTVQYDNAYSTITYVIKLERRPLFMMINLVVPIFILSISNLLVFLLPLDTTERVSFSVTMLLTFTVFLTMVTDELPATDILSNFNVFLLLQMSFSTIITICVLLIFYVYRKRENKAFPKSLSWITKSMNRINKRTELSKECFQMENESQWITIASVMNTCSFITFSMIILIEFAIFCYVTSRVDGS